MRTHLSLRLGCAVALVVLLGLGGCSSGVTSSDPQMISTPYMDQPAQALSETEYRDAVDRVATVVNGSLGAFATALDQGDLEAAIESLDQIIEVRELAAGLAPPPEMAVIHEELMQGLNGYSQFAQAMENGLAGGDAQQAKAVARSSGALLSESSEHFQNALRVLGM